MEKDRKLRFYHVCIYLVVFFVIWGIRELVIRPLILDSLNDIMFHVVETSTKLLIWTLPAILLIQYFHDDMWVGLKEMFTNKLQWFRQAPLLVAFLAAIPVVAWVITGKLAVNTDLKPLSLIESVVFVGITEETVFRGFLLNAMLKKWKISTSILVTAVLFALIHYSIWIYYGYNATTILLSSVAVMLLSAPFSYAFVKTRNLFVPMFLHMAYNLLVGLFIGTQ